MVVDHGHTELVPDITLVMSAASPAHSGAASKASRSVSRKALTRPRSRQKDPQPLIEPLFPVYRDLVAEKVAQFARVAAF
jgi:hypothetical protein